MKKKIIIGITVLLILCGGIGLSYAAWTIDLEQLGENKIQSTCFSLSLTNEKNEIHLQNAYPILNSEGKKLTPYSFTITKLSDVILASEYQTTPEIAKEKIHNK